MQYTYDEILGRMTYTVVPEAVDVVSALDIATRFKELDIETREYLLTRLIMWSKEHDEA